MSWRTQGQYCGLGESDAAFLREFDRKWEQKANGRSQTDAMEHIVRCDGIEQRSAQDDEKDSLSIDALLISLGAQVSKISRPHPYRLGWRFYISLRTGRKARAFFDDYEGAAQAYLAACEFMHWFQGATDSDLEKQQEGGSPRESGSPLANRPAQDAPRERGPSHLVLCPPQKSPSDPTEPPTPLARSRPA